MFQSVLINTYARRVKTQKYPRIFMRTIRSWGFNYFIDQAAPPQQGVMRKFLERIYYNILINKVAKQTKNSVSAKLMLMRC